MSKEKHRYSDAELAEFKEIINKKLEDARVDFEMLRNSLNHKDDHGTDDTGRSFNMMEDGSETLMREEMANLANRQGAETQSAQLAQQINLTQGQFTQQAQMTEAEQRQQVRLQSLQNEQQAAMANLGNDQQIELANLQVEADRLGANQSATNQIFLHVGSQTTI